MADPASQRLDFPELHALRAAQGWLELGNAREAKAELAALDPSLQNHPESLKVRWFIAIKERELDAACDLARTLTGLFPDQADWHLNLANSLYWRGQPAAARDAVLAVLDRFPGHAGLQYNLACYECQLARFQEARQWLECAFALDQKLRTVARQDPDLEPLWRQNDAPEVQ